MSSSSTFNNPNVGGPLDALDWSSVDPEDVTSLLMAADLGHFSGDETVMKQRLEELTERSRVEQRARDAVAVSRPLVVLPDDESQSSSDEEVPSASPDEAPSPTSPQPGHDGEDDEADGDDGGMGSRRGTAEASWDETDWKLVRIIRRRRCAPLPGSVAQAADAAEHEHAAVELLWEYQCVWDGCTEPTWERGAFLMEMGFGVQLKSFVDSKRPPVFKPTKRLLPDKPPSHEEYHRKRQELRQHRRQRMHHGVWSRFCGRVAAQLAQHAPKGLNGVIDGLVATSSSIRASVPDPTIGLPTEHECPDQLHSLLWYLFGHAFVSYQLHVTEFETVFPASLERVVQRAATEEGSIELVYHGTRQSAVAAITREGLRLPQDHKGGVLNGSAYGLGIYVGPCLDYPVMDRYSPEGDVFVCLSFCPKADPQAYHKVNSQITVIKKDGLVAPLFHVSFDRKQSGNTNIQRVMAAEKERVVFRANFS